MALRNRNKGVGAMPLVALAAVVAAVAGWFFLGKPGGSAPEELSADGVTFEVVDAAHRELDGSPALALSFSLPLDAKSDIGQFLQVMEVPPLPGTVKPRVRDDSEEYDEDYNPSSDAKLGTGVSRKPEDTTLDDLEEFRACQQGYNGIALKWNDMCRGSKHWVQGADAAAQEIDLHPKLSGIKTEDEGLYTEQHRYWLETMQRALEVESKKA